MMDFSMLNLVYQASRCCMTISTTGNRHRFAAVQTAKHLMMHLWNNMPYTLPYHCSMTLYIMHDIVYYAGRSYRKIARII